MPDLLSLLFVGVNEENRLIIRQYLQNSPYKILEDSCPTGAAALELLSTADYQIILLSDNLPDENSLDWHQRIRANGFSRPVIVLGSLEAGSPIPAVFQQHVTSFITQSQLTAEVITRVIKQLLVIYHLTQDHLLVESQLHLNQLWLREAQKMTSLGNWEINLETKELHWSEEIYQILEFDPKLKPDYEAAFSLTHPQDRSHFQEVMDAAIREKKKFHFEYRILLPGNRIKHVSVHGHPVLNNAGKATSIIGTLQDISNQVSTRNALKESEKRYLMLLETMNEGVLHVDNDQKILYANKSFCEKMGYDRWEVIGETLFRFVSDAKTKDLVNQKSQLRYQNISDQYEMVLQHKTGRRICFLVGASPLQGEDGVVTGSLGTFTDITERKEIEEALQSSEKLFRTLFEDSQGFLCTHTLNGTILSINKAGADMVGLKPKALQGKNFRKVLAPGSGIEFDRYLGLISKQKKATGIFRITNSSQHTFHYIVYKNILYQEKGKAPYVIVSAQDITNRIDIEEELRQAKLVAENSVIVKEQFLANISHEIRTPMNGIIGLTSVLQKMVVEEEQQGYLQAIQSSADKLLIIINDILDFSKIESGKLEFEMIAFNPRSLLQESIQLFETKAAEKNNRIKVILDADVPELVIGDPGKLSQIINNLLSNAIKFTQDGLIRILLEVISDQADTCQLEFQVQDNGIGIPDDKLSAVFESFTQASSDTTRKFGGTGLGLTISKQLVELQGGKISVQSQPGLGSTFSFRLSFNKIQINPNQVSINTDLPPVSCHDLPKLKILLAEDNLINQILVKKIVKDWGYELHIAENGIEALALFNTNRYDVILMDMQMPEMDGYEATAHIRQSPGPESATPIIALTAHASQREADKCLQAGADLYVSKPFKQEKLLAEIAALLQKETQTLQPINAIQNQPEQTPVLQESFINLQYLREMGDGDEDFVIEIITMFIDQTPENLENLAAYAAAGNWKEVKALAHKMKSSVMMIGNQELEKIFVNLQLEAISTSPPDTVPGLIKRAEFICGGAIAALEKELMAYKKIIDY